MIKFKTSEQAGKKYVALCALNMKIDLKNHFPGIKFYVTSKSYSGGNCITVECDSLLREHVEKILSKWKAGEFDYNDDHYEYKSTELHEKYGSAQFIDIKTF